RETDGTSEEDESTGGESGELGTVGSYQVDVVSGLLNMEMKDFVWEGNRMPVSVRHSFRGQFANRSYLWKDGVTNPYANMQIGYGWRLNLMQCMVHTGIISGSNSKDTYTYIDESENETVFTQCDCESGTCTKYEDVNGLGYVYDAATGIMNKGTEEYRFTDGRLTKITDEYGNSMTIVFDTSGRISCVTDGVNRTFIFNYDDSNLISIVAPNEAVVSLAYRNNRLCCASFPNGQTLSIDYHATTGMPTSVTVTDTSVQNAAPLTTNFTLESDGTIVKRIVAVGSYRSVEFDYRNGNQTIVTETEAADGDECPAIVRHRVLLREYGDNNYSYYECDNESKIKVTGTNSIVVPYTEPGLEIGNLKCQNLLSDHNFSTDIRNLSDSHPIGAWHTNLGNHFVQYDPPERMPGQCSALLINRLPTDVDKGIWQDVTLECGKDYVFSCYLKLSRNGSDSNHGIYLMVQADGYQFVSQRITTPGEYQRVVLPFHVGNACCSSFRVGIYIAGNVYAKAIAPQLEEGTYLSPYNYMTTRHIILGGNNVPVKVATVYVPSGKDVKETYTLSGYISGEMDETDYAGVNAKIYYADNEAPEENYLPLYGIRTERTFFMVQFSKKQYRGIKKIEIVLTNDQNENAAHFTDVQLVRNCYEDGLSEEDFVGVTYDETEEESEIDDRAADAPTDVESIVFEEVKDAFGNVLTSTNFQNGEFGTIYGESKYEETVGGTTDEPVYYHDDGNNKTEETDARGNATRYTNDPVISKPKKVTDRCGNKTEYTYDNTGRTTGVKAANGGTVGYGYNGYDEVTEIVRGDGQAYAMAYDSFRNLTSVKVGNQNLVAYSYKAGTDRLKTVSYANGSQQKLTYDRFGNVIKEVWERSENNEHIKEAEYRYFYDASQNLTKTVDILNGKMYTIIRRGDNIVSVEEYDIVWDETDGATNPILVGTMVYSFDGKGKQFRKKYVPADGSEEQKYVFAFNDEQNVAVQLPTGAVSHAKADYFGRKVFDELQLGKGFLNRSFTYYDGVVSEQHEETNKRVSEPTTLLVKDIKFANGRTIQYEFDEEDRITKVIDSVDGTIVYTYDALGQLLTETKGETVVNTMTYDKYGNVRTKNGAVFAYDSNGAWKDLLKRIESQNDPNLNGEIDYDAYGNPISYLGHALTWEKGRQLKQFDGIIYKYNNEGVRIEKVENCRIHQYVLENKKILKEIVADTCCNGNGYTNEYLYGIDGTVCGIKHNDAAYYFCKNLQNDVIAITDETGAVVARYSYDAWGKCTIVEDNSNCGIATVNPFRYRGYYYDSEIGTYYLQSRYYDPEIGRFISADNAALLWLPSNRLPQNAFSYCNNNVVNAIDPLGYIAILDDLLVLKLIATTLLLITIISWMSTPEFKEAWTSFCNDIGNDLASVWDVIVAGGQAAWDWSRGKVKKTTAAIKSFLVVVKADAKIRLLVRRNSRDRYWTATLRRNYVDIGRPITYAQAVKEVSSGRDVFTVTRSEAKAVAKAAYSNKKPVEPEIDKGKENTIGYYYHYHVYGRKKKGHVFFLFW
ncbi:MAG: RHS repeat-associated core domain-containing protein, partial [Clostridia bacterium]|nr:RHS repeat-associated core domain-containing protein [Clostridia bacterium]